MIKLVDTIEALDGLELMTKEMMNTTDHVAGKKDIAAALFITALAKKADDKPEWFPKGKWATIQLMEARIGEQIDKMLR